MTDNGDSVGAEVQRLTIELRNAQRRAESWERELDRVRRLDERHRARIGELEAELESTRARAEDRERTFQRMETVWANQVAQGQDAIRATSRELRRMRTGRVIDED